MNIPGNLYMSKIVTVLVAVEGQCFQVIDPQSARKCDSNVCSSVCPLVVKTSSLVIWNCYSIRRINFFGSIFHSHKPSGRTFPIIIKVLNTELPVVQNEYFSLKTMSQAGKPADEDFTIYLTYRK